MASPNPGCTSPQGQPLRLPKLSYRTKSCDTESVSSASTGLTRSTASTTPTSPLQSDFCPSPRSPPSEMSLPSSPRQSSFGPSPKAPSNLNKKGSKFLSGLFGVKEPSAQALQDYERQLKKHGRGRVSAVGMPGVSSAKLPATVPKVNSKWDGVPRTWKEREKHSDAGRQSMSGLTRRPGSSRSGGSDHRATSTADSSRRRVSRGTLDSVSTRSGSSNNLAELYGWETNSPHSGSSTINFSAEHRSTTSRSAPSLPKTFSTSPHEPSAPLAITSPPVDLPPPSPSGSRNPPSLSNSPVLTPFDSSPATPNTPPPLISLIPPKLESDHRESINIASLEAPGFANEVIVKSAGVNVLGPPAVAKRKPKPTPLQPCGRHSKTSGAGFQSSSGFVQDVPVAKVAHSPRPSLASCFSNTTGTPISGSPTSVLPGHDSARERPLLGTNLKNRDVAQWNYAKPATGVNTEDEKIITPTAEGGKSLGRKSRMTFFRK